MARVQMRLMVGALAAATLLGVTACGGGSSKKQPPPPTAIDLLSGNGTFDIADAWTSWTAGGGAITPGIVDCTDLTGKCFQVTSADYGANTYTTQIVYWNTTAGEKTDLSLKSTKQYKIKFRGKESGATSEAGATIQLWLQNKDDGTDIHSYTAQLTGAVASYESPAITVPADETINFMVNFGTQTDHAGVSFAIDDIQVLESDKPTPPAGNDLLTQGDFESSPGTDIWNSWSNDNGNATFMIANCSADGFTGNCMTVSGSNFGDNPWSTQLLYWDSVAQDAKLFLIDTAKTYTAKFRARASADGVTLQPEFQGSKATYAPTYPFDQPITTTAADYAVPMTGLTADNLGFKINFVKANAIDTVTVEIDNIQLTVE